MRICWVGGISRQKGSLEKAASDAGHSLAIHSGDTGGRGAEGLEKLIARSDVVVIVTEVNSHGGMLRAKEQARRLGRPAYLIRRASVSSLQRVLLQLREERPAA
jgi:hypothetical protein